MRAAFIGDEVQIARVFGQGRRETLETRAEFLPDVVEPDDPRLNDIEAIFSTWGMPLLTPAQLDKMTQLRAVFYAAGAVGHFSKPLVEREIPISSAWQANAIPVAEFCLAQILLACKRYFPDLRNRSSERGTGVYGETVALLGAGAIGTRLIEMLRPLQLNVLVFDPHMTSERAESLQVRKVSLQTAFQEAYVVSNHLLDVPDTYGLIHQGLLSSMRPYATLINTGRGRTVVTDDLIQTLRDRIDLTALLDVTDPEPLPPDHPLRQLPNAFISSHIAGSIGDEVLRMADYMIEEFDRYQRGEPLLYRVYA